MNSTACRWLCLFGKGWRFEGGQPKLRAIESVTAPASLPFPAMLNHLLVLVVWCLNKSE